MRRSGSASRSSSRDFNSWLSTRATTSGFALNVLSMRSPESSGPANTDMASGMIVSAKRSGRTRRTPRSGGDGGGGGGAEAARAFSITSASSGTRTSWPHVGHLAFFPAREAGAFNPAPQGHSTLIFPAVSGCSFLQEGQIAGPGGASKRWPHAHNRWGMAQIVLISCELRSVREVESADELRRGALSAPDRGLHRRRPCALGPFAGEKQVGKGRGARKTPRRRARRGDERRLALADDDAPLRVLQARDGLSKLAEEVALQLRVGTVDDVARGALRDRHARALREDPLQPPADAREVAGRLNRRVEEEAQVDKRLRLHRGSRGEEGMGRLRAEELQERRRRDRADHEPVGQPVEPPVEFDGAALRPDLRDGAIGDLAQRDRRHADPRSLL